MPAPGDVAHDPNLLALVAAFGELLTSSRVSFMGVLLPLLASVCGRFDSVSRTQEGRIAALESTWAYGSMSWQTVNPLRNSSEIHSGSKVAVPVRLFNVSHVGGEVKGFGIPDFRCGPNTGESPPNKYSSQSVKHIDDSSSIPEVACTTRLQELRLWAHCRIR